MRRDMAAVPGRDSQRDRFSTPPTATPIPETSIMNLMALR
jgi:hypothetical protein